MLSIGGEETKIAEEEGEEKDCLPPSQYIEVDGVRIAVWTQ